MLGGRGRSVLAGALALAATVVLGPLSAIDGAAQSKRVRPVEEGAEQYPAHPNRDDAFYFCTACHSFKLVAAQGMSRERWDERLSWMVQHHNMPDVQGEDRAKILDYLSSAFPERQQPGGWKNPFAPK
jgi:hypothetical protein